MQSKIFSDVVFTKAWPCMFAEDKAEDLQINGMCSPILYISSCQDWINNNCLYQNWMNAFPNINTSTIDQS
jgi:hypothetical protein